MLDLIFRDKLTGTGGDFLYGLPNQTSILFPEKGERPFFTSSNKTNVLIYSMSVQFANRSLSQEKAREVMNGARIPIKVKLSGTQYLMAKGFCARITNDGKITPLFIAMYNENARSIEDIKFYVCRSVFRLSQYRQLKTIMLGFIVNHPGTVVITTEIEKHFGARIELPVGRTIAEKKQNTEKFVEDLLEKVKSSV
jgi:hypothetical protein